METGGVGVIGMGIGMGLGVGFAIVSGVGLRLGVGVGLGTGTFGARFHKPQAFFPQNTQICSLHEQFAQSIHALLQYTSRVVFLHRGHVFSDGAGYLSLQA